MDKYVGKSVMRGIAIGRVYLYKKVDIQVTDEKVADAAAEKERFLEAVDRAKAVSYTHLTLPTNSRV